MRSFLKVKFSTIRYYIRLYYYLFTEILSVFKKKNLQVDNEIHWKYYIRIINWMFTKSNVSITINKINSQPINQIKIQFIILIVLKSISWIFYGLNIFEYTSKSIVLNRSIVRDFKSCRWKMKNTPIKFSISIKNCNTRVTGWEALR